MMQCALSGELPQQPVISAKSGNVFERRLIETYISEHGTDPVSNEPLTIDDLIAVKTNHTARPRPPTFTSIPSLLSAFQNEWDALVLDSYTIRQQLSQTRQELATALYQHDAAIRVVTRLTKERDEARDALSKVSVAQGSGNGDAMQVDSSELPAELAAKVDATMAELSKGRKKRQVSKTWATGDAISEYTQTGTSPTLVSTAAALAYSQENGSVFIGGEDGTAIEWDIRENTTKHDVQADAPITDVLYAGAVAVFATASGEIQTFDGGKQMKLQSKHAGKVVALALHPCGEILASVGVDRSFVFYDLTSGRAVAQTFFEATPISVAFHPDGHLLAIGAEDGQIKMYHTKSGEFAAAFDAGGAVTSLCFSENGIWFTAVARGSSSVIVFDIRKEGSQAKIKVLDIGSTVSSIVWDYTGQFLATAGPGGVSVQQYTKSSKTWSEPLRSAIPATVVSWADEGSMLVLAGTGGAIVVLGSA